MLVEYANTTQNSTKYRGYGTGPPKGPKRYKSNEELITPKRGLFFGGGSLLNRAYYVLRFVVTHIVGWSVLIAVAVFYAMGMILMRDGNGRFAIGMYGAFLFCHLAVQAFFAGLEHLYARRNPPPNDYATKAPSKIALQISAYQEDPDYLRECLLGITKLEYPRSKLKVLLCIDGNGDDSEYMVDIFEKVMNDAGLSPVYFRWDYNYHELPEGVDNDRNGVDLLEKMIADNQYICLMQAWGGKREVMFTAFKALGDSVDYVQVCDSDTKLDPYAMMELAWVLDNQPESGAVGGDVKILNEGDSYISFLSSLRYWMAFNTERACQSYFGCVSCISGPLGLYRMNIVQEILDLWSDQKFLGEVCTFGDDRHLTNRMLQLGHATKFTPRSICLTETPAEYTRWLAQQVRWSKSYFREWLFNALWWHKHHLWMVYENIVAGGFPFFVMATVIMTFFSGSLWNVVFLLLTIQFVGILKGVFAVCVRGSTVMLFMSLYSSLYITSLLPGKLFAIATIKKKGWGTSGRKTMLSNYNSLIPVVFWLLMLGGGLFMTLAINEYKREKELEYLVSGVTIYIFYWVFVISSWKLLVQSNMKKKSDYSDVENSELDDGSDAYEIPAEKKFPRGSVVESNYTRRTSFASSCLSNRNEDLDIPTESWNARLGDSENNVSVVSSDASKGELGDGYGVVM